MSSYGKNEGTSGHDVDDLMNFTKKIRLEAIGRLDESLFEEF